MGISVIRETVHGNQLEVICDTQRLFFPLVDLAIRRRQDFKLLKYIDEYGLTTFNQLQIPQFIFECHSLRQHTKVVAERNILDQIILLAEQAIGEPHTYIRLMGV